MKVLLAILFLMASIFSTNSLAASVSVRCKVTEEVGNTSESFEVGAELSDIYQKNVTKGMGGAWAPKNRVFFSRLDLINWEIAVSFISSPLTGKPLIDIALTGLDRRTKKVVTETWTARGSIDDLVMIAPLVSFRGINVRCASSKFNF